MDDEDEESSKGGPYSERKKCIPVHDKTPREQLDGNEKEKLSDVKVIWLIGGPGAGKGTQAKKIAEKYKCSIIGGGELMRKEMSENTKKGKEIKTALEEGRKPSKEIIWDLIIKATRMALYEENDYIIFDGTPRDSSKVELFEDDIKPCDLILKLQLDDNSMETRIQHRAKIEVSINYSIMTDIFSECSDTGIKEEIIIEADPFISDSGPYNSGESNIDDEKVIISEEEIFTDFTDLDTIYSDLIRPIKEEPTSPDSQEPLAKLKPRKRKVKEMDDAWIGIEHKNILSVLKAEPGNEKSHKNFSEEQPYSCIQCEYKSKFNSNLKKHIQQVHNNERPYICDLCSKTYKNKISLGNHKELVHERNEIMCDDCGRTFFTKMNLRRHKRNLHSVKPQKNKLNMVEHDNSEIEDSKEPFTNEINVQKRNVSDSFICDECGKKLPCKSKLNLHVQIQHHGVLPYTCDQCDKKYKYFVSLKNHKLVHSGIATFNCDHCTEKFISNRTLVRHLNDSHSIQTHKKYFRERPKTHICRICSKYFRGISEVKRHEVVHTGERNHICHICNKAFSQKKQMKEHINQHLAGNLDISGFQINK